MGDLLTPMQVATVIGMKRERVYELIREGAFPIIKPGGQNGRKIFVDTDDLNAYLDSCKYRYKEKVET